jgi:HK97 gp10 family phage protein
MPQKQLFKVTGDKKIIDAFRKFGPAFSKQVAKPAAKRAAAKFQSAIRARTPVASGKMRRSIRVRTAKGPRGFAGRTVVAFATMIGQAKPTKSQLAKKTKIPYYAFMQEKGYHIGKRQRTGSKVTGYTPHVGKSVVRFMPGRHFVKRALKANEGKIGAAMLQEMYDGIDRMAERGG